MDTDTNMGIGFRREENGTEWRWEKGEKGEKVGTVTA